ncbi:SDR family NAD(P)-dependent oxidoreductase [Taklimakanibacter deserti]|uniref:SDR family NAD(P)-dependent oxidoreductase n=1 Tax=Taklimakanibacter deserti TaxID=2267839 RepID=UPI000E64E8B4
MMVFDYSGKSVLVTGAGRGLGFAIAQAFLAAGASVFLNDRTAEQVDAAIAKAGGGEHLIPAPADLATAKGAALALAPVLRHGRLDILVNNAAVNIEKPIEETDDAHWDLHLAVVLKAAFFTTRTALPLLTQSQGSVVNIASELGLQAIADNIAYVSAKHGLIAMTRSMALELAPLNIRLNALCPGTMDTELMQDCARASGDPDDYYRRFRQYHPLGRLATPQEIAAFVLCLASPAAAFMTGSAVAIDGGSSAGRM